MNFISPTNPVFNTLLFYIIIISLIFLMKPHKFFCKKTSQIKQFGYTHNTTIIPLPLFSILLAVGLYLSFSAVELLYVRLNNRIKL